MEEVRVRFAPSPTGPLHIGGVRTALFNYLFAKKHQGKFLLRIEDTDQTRYIPGTEEYIMESLAWCGIKIDEGVNEGGPYGPYRQSYRKKIYKEYADKLIETGNAYFAFDTPEELDKLRLEYEANKKIFTYDTSVRKNLKNSLALSKEEVAQLISTGYPYVLRFKIPENEVLQIKDIIRGNIIVNTSLLDDKVLFKSDGMPTYHLANIVDDHLMKITHVIRGEEWLPSLPLHVLLYRAFGWTGTMPEFAHLPLLLKPRGQGKLSKRDGDKMGFPVFPLEWKSPEGEIFMGYRESGYFSDAFVNILALLGWNPGTEKEVFSMEEMINAFSLDRVGKSGSRFDPEKAKWFNHQYLQKKTDAELAGSFMLLLQQKNIKAEKQVVTKIVGMVKERINFVSEMWEQSSFFFEAPASYDEQIIKKKWKEETPETLNGIVTFLNEQDLFNAENLEVAFKKYLEKNEMDFGQVMIALRLVLIGSGKGPALFDIMEIIGKEETIKRVIDGIKNITKN